MTEPSQYFKGRTVQEQMNEVIGYVDVRAEEVAAAKADDVLEPAEQAKTDAIAAKEAAEDAKDVTLAALPAVNERISDVESDLNAVTLRVTTAEGDIVTIQGRITAVENKNTQQDSAIAALQTADNNNVKITGTNAIGNFAVLLTNNQTIQAVKNFSGELIASGIWNNKISSNLEQTSTWRRVYYNVTTGTNQMLALLVTPQKPGQNTDEYGILIIGNSFAKWIVKGNGIINENYIVVVNTDNQLELWVKNVNGNRGVALIRLNETNWGNLANNWRSDISTTNPDFDPTTYQSYTVSS